MKYALRRQEIAMCSPEYVTEHILKSLNSYFGKQDNNKVICWQPIPSFDEILEANRDVLERIKEKGD